MHGKALRNKYMDNHTYKCPDSGKYQHARACNRAEKTANWLTTESAVNLLTNRSSLVKLVCRDGQACLPG